MLDYEKINKRMEKKMHNIKEEKKEQKYIGSLLFLLHLCLGSGMLWLGAMLSAPIVWFVIIGYGVLFLVSITVHKNGHSGKAILLTIGSLFLGIFLLVAACVGILSHIH